MKSRHHIQRQEGRMRQTNNSFEVRKRHRWAEGKQAWTLTLLLSFSSVFYFPSSSVPSACLSFLLRFLFLLSVCLSLYFPASANPKSFHSNSETYVLPNNTFFCSFSYFPKFPKCPSPRIFRNSRNAPPSLFSKKQKPINFLPSLVFLETSFHPRTSISDGPGFGSNRTEPFKTSLKRFISSNIIKWFGLVLIIDKRFGFSLVWFGSETRVYRFIGLSGLVLKLGFIGL